MMQYRCDVCGVVQSVAQVATAEGIAEPDMPPDGWRSIWTTIMEHEGNTIDPIQGQVSHACEVCSGRVSIDEHFEAEHTARKVRMKNY